MVITIHEMLASGIEIKLLISQLDFMLLAIIFAVHVAGLFLKKPAFDVDDAIHSLKPIAAKSSAGVLGLLASFTVSKLL